MSDGYEAAGLRKAMNKETRQERTATSGRQPTVNRHRGCGMVSYRFHWRKSLAVRICANFQEFY